MIFNFNQYNKKGLYGVIYGKGLFPCITLIISTLTWTAGFILMPWDNDIREILFRIFILLIIVLSLFNYYRTIIEMKIEENVLSVKVWKKEIKYNTDEIRTMKATYYASCGIVKILIKTSRNYGIYFLWAPSHEKERYDLFLNMQNYIDNLPRQTK